MAYFDSAKNRTLWKEELDRLRQEKEKRQQRGFQPNDQDGEALMMDSSNPHRVRINFRQLEAELNARRQQPSGRERSEERMPSAERALGRS